MNPVRARDVWPWLAADTLRHSRDMTTDPRTGMTILEAQECWALLRSAEVGRLAIAIMNRPDIFPVNHLIDGRTIVLRMAEGTTLAGAVLGQDVAFEVDGYDAQHGDAWSVVVKGRVVEQRLYELFDASDLPMFSWHATPKPRFAADRAGVRQRPALPRR